MRSKAPHSPFAPVLALLALMGLSACVNTGGGDVRDAAPGERSIEASLNAAKSYPLSAGDVVRISVFGEDRVSGQFTVDAGGNIAVPLIGSVRAEGFTVDTLAETVGAKLAAGGFVSSPRVTAEIVSFRPFYILGEVNTPGEYAFKPGMSLLTAVALAGGYSYRADHGTVLIRRAGETEAVRYDLDDGDIGIFPGDVIQVPQRFF